MRGLTNHKFTLHGRVKCAERTTRPATQYPLARDSAATHNSLALGVDKVEERCVVKKQLHASVQVFELRRVGRFLLHQPHQHLRHLQPTPTRFVRGSGNFSMTCLIRWCHDTRQKVQQRAHRTLRKVNAAHLSSSCDPEASIKPRKQLRSSSQYSSCRLSPCVACTTRMCSTNGPIGFVEFSTASSVSSALIVTLTDCSRTSSIGDADMSAGGSHTLKLTRKETINEQSGRPGVLLGNLTAFNSVCVLITQ